MNNRLRKLRKALDMTQDEFAKRIGTVQNTITGYENGRRKPSNPVISSICKEFRVNETWLRTGEEEMFLPEPTDELDALAEKYNLTHGDYVFIEYLLRDANTRHVLEDFCISYAKDILKGDVSPETPSLLNEENVDIPLEVDLASLSDEDADALGRAYAEELKKKRDSMGESEAFSENA